MDITNNSGHHTIKTGMKTYRKGCKVQDCLHKFYEAVPINEPMAESGAYR